MEGKVSTKACGTLQVVDGNVTVIVGIIRSIRYSYMCHVWEKREGSVRGKLLLLLLL